MTLRAVVLVMLQLNQQTSPAAAPAAGLPSEEKNAEEEPKFKAFAGKGHSLRG
jgi:hypothetical protein